MSVLSEKLDRPRSRTPCLDENRVDENENCGDNNNSKEFELSDISDDEDEQWQGCNSKSDDTYTNGNQNSANANGSGNEESHPQKESINKESAFKKITKSNRDRNYRDNIKRRLDLEENYELKQNRNIDNSRKKEIERYNVRKIVSNREFTISRSRSKSYSPIWNRTFKPREKYSSTKQDFNYHRHRRSITPVGSRNQRKSIGYSPISISPPPSNRHSSLSPDHSRSKYGYRRKSLSIDDENDEKEKLKRGLTRQTKNRHKHRSVERSSRRKKHRCNDHKKHKKSRSKSKRRSSSPSISPQPKTMIPSSSNRNINVTNPSSVSPSRQRQIMNITNSNLPQENIKIILKNDEVFTKRQKTKKRDKKNNKKKEKVSRKDLKEKLLLPSSMSTQKKEKILKEQQQTKEVFASGDNILISVCFNNKNNEGNDNSKPSNNNNNNNNAISGAHCSNDQMKSKLQKNDILEEKVAFSDKTKIKKRQASPLIRSTLLSDSSISSISESYDKLKRRQKKHKRKKSKRGDFQNKSSPKTPPMDLPPISSQSVLTKKRKIDMKPIAIIDLEKSPGKEITQSPKEIIILSDSDGESLALNKKRDSVTGSKDIVIIEDTILEKGSTLRNHSHDHVTVHSTPTNATPESPPLASLPTPQQPVLKFSLKSKSNILPFNLLHDQAEETEEANGNTNSNAISESQIHTKNINNPQKEQLQQQLDSFSGIPIEDKSSHNQNEAYDPFEPTKSRSNSPVTPPLNFATCQQYEPTNEANNIIIKQIESLNEKTQANNAKDSNQIPGLGNEDQIQSSSTLWTKKTSQQQLITSPLPPSFIFSSSSSLPAKPQQHISLYDGIYGSDLKTPVVPSPIKATKSSIIDKNKNMNNKKNNNSGNNENNNADEDDDNRTPYSPSSDGYDYEPRPPSTSAHHSKSNFESQKHSDLDTQSSEPSGSYSFERNDESASKISSTPLKLTTSTLKTFNSSMRSSSSGLQFVNKAELSIFENYLPASQRKSPLVKRQSNSSFIHAKMSRFASSMNENNSPTHRSGGGIAPFSDMILKPISVIDESILDDEVPSSAVDLVNKDKFLKKSLRIERVAEEVKLILKPHYNKKHITKDEYKEILRKSVPKICHNKTGEINIQKITQLIEAYIKKFRYKRRAGMASSI